VLVTERYLDQTARWPRTGRHILAHFDSASVVVYQAYQASIGEFAAAHGFLGGEFSYSRMSWIKPNFLWMMHRSGWGTKPGQEVTLALRIRRSFFEMLLTQAVSSSYSEAQYSTRAEWQKALSGSSVRLQWDPDHDPRGVPLPRRAIQLGLRAAVLEAFGKRELLEVLDISPFVAEQRANMEQALGELRTPVEQVYVPAEGAIRARLELEESRPTTA
jgi:hypothetical protein